MLGRPLSGSRTWMWQMAAPVFAAPMQASAISCGVTGSAGFCARVGKLPVTAQVKMVGFMTLPRISCPGCTILRASLGLELHRDAVDAVVQSRRLRPIVEA